MKPCRYCGRKNWTKGKRIQFCCVQGATDWLRRFHLCFDQIVKGRLTCEDNAA